MIVRVVSIKHNMVSDGIGLLGVKAGKGVVLHFSPSTYITGGH